MKQRYSSESRAARTVYQLGSAQKKRAPRRARSECVYSLTSRGPAITKQRCEIQWEAHESSDLKNTFICYLN